MQDEPQAFDGFAEVIDLAFYSLVSCFALKNVWTKESRVCLLHSSMKSLNVFMWSVIDKSCMMISHLAVLRLNPVSRMDSLTVSVQISWERNIVHTRAHQKMR